MTRKTIAYNGYQIEYVELCNEGPETWFAFHGFSRMPEDFSIFCAQGRRGRRILSFSLFQHCGARVPQERVEQNQFKPEEWGEIFSFLLDYFTLEKVNLLGYSMGGKVSLQSFDMRPDKIGRMILVAPDGIKINWFYRFAAGTRAGNRLAKTFIDEPKRLTVIANFLYRAKILPKNLYTYYTNYARNENIRLLVYETWLAYVHMRPNLNNIALHAKKQETDIVLIFGKYDRVIPPHLGRKLAKILAQPNKLHILEEGHLLINPKTVNFLVEQNIW